MQTSTTFYRLGTPISDVGFAQYRQAWNDPLFRGALWTTLKLVTAAVAIATTLGLGLALLCVRELPFIRTLRMVLIVPMVITPVVVGIVFRLIYASGVGLFPALSGLPARGRER